MYAKIKLGSTLSQRGLSLRIRLHVSTIRHYRHKVVGYVRGKNGGAWRETWERGEMSSTARTYTLIKVEG